MGLTLVGYIRVSGDSQKDNSSLPEQAEQISKYCKQHGHKLFNIFQDVYSAENAEDREAFQNALKVVYADFADGIIVHKFDRFTRNVFDAEGIRGKFEKRGKTLISILDPVSFLSADDVLLYQIKSVLSERERKEIQARCHRGRIKKFQGGGIVGGAPPYGYIATSKTLIPYPPEQAILAKIFEWAKTENCRTIADRLNELGVPTKRKRKWVHGTIWQILNRTCVGLKNLDLARTTTPEHLQWLTDYKQNGYLQC